MIPSKSIVVPGSPPVDIAPYQPLIDHPRFQVLRERKQLGVNYLIFPGAVHTRFEHVIGTLSLTERLCRVHGLPEERRRQLGAFALLHDLGHGPFSHQTEPILGGDHHARGLACLDEMMPELDACGVDRAALAAMFLGEHPDATLVCDRNLGTDKLDYLMRDALHIGFPGIPDIERIQFYTVLDQGPLAIEEKYMEEIKRLQKFYSYLHQHGYLNKTALTAQRMLQRAMQEALESGALAAEAVWGMGDRQLLDALERSPSALARDLVERLLSRRLHASALVLKPGGYGFVERCSDKPVAVVEWPLPNLRRFASLVADNGRLRELEDEFAAALGLPPGGALFAAMPYFRKLLPQDVRISSANSGGGFGLFEKDRDHLRSLEGDYLRTFAVRLVVPREHRERISARSEWLGERLAACL
ncbi:MAG: HD domain-containing protein [Lentisphaeria bacterium]|nr:HD domain-containing protein [Lentisphaeria bacterium]